MSKPTVTAKHVPPIFIGMKALAILAVAVFAIIQSQSDDDDSDIPASP